MWHQIHLDVTAVGQLGGFAQMRLRLDPAVQIRPYEDSLLTIAVTPLHLLGQPHLGQLTRWE